MTIDRATITELMRRICEVRNENDRLRHMLLLSQDTLDSAVAAHRVVVNDFGRQTITDPQGEKYEGYLCELIHPLTDRYIRCPVDALLVANAHSPEHYLAQEREDFWEALRQQIVSEECYRIESEANDDADPETSDHPRA